MERHQLAIDIAGIFSSITYKGRIEELINFKDKDVVSIELFHDDLSWRIYDFKFDTSNKLIKIDILGGVKQQKIIEGYKRK